MKVEAHRWVALARILKARGNKGEVAAELLTDFPERITKMQEVYVREADGRGEARRVGLRQFWMDRNHPGKGVFHFEGSGSISDAEKYRGMEVLLPIEERVELPAGKYFVSDLIGCAVFECKGTSEMTSAPCAMETAPRLVGEVRDVQFTGESTAGVPVLEIETREGELLVPLAEEICRRIDVAARRIEVKLPEGLRELNAEE